MSGWIDRLRVDPLPALLAADDPALVWSVRGDLLGEASDPAALWELPAAASLLRRQHTDGSWRYTGKRAALARAAQFLLGFQTDEGDLRGIYASQYAPNYTAAILAVLIDAPGRRRLGDPPPHTPHAADAQLRPRHAAAAPASARPLAALLAPGHRHRLARVRRPPALPLRYPFRWTDILSALDAITLVGARHDEPAIAGALAWLTDRQDANGLWHSSYEKAHDPHIHEWVSFAIARVFRRIHDGSC